MHEPTPPTPAPHHAPPPHAGMPILVGLLGLLLVLETLALGYVLKLYLSPQEPQMVIIEEEQEEPALVPPLLYTRKSEESAYGNAVVKIDPRTGAEEVVYTPPVGKAVDILSVPQVNYDGRVFLGVVCGACDNNSWEDIVELNLEQNNDTETADFFDPAFMVRDALEVSPDQTKIALTRYENVETSSSGVVEVIDVLTGQKQQLSALGEGEYFSQYFGQNTLGQAAGYELRWTNLGCFNVTIYEDDEMNVSGDFKSYKESRAYCLENE